jgi:broad specificity phosphatase PhoE
VALDHRPAQALDARQRIRHRANAITALYPTGLQVPPNGDVARQGAADDEAGTHPRSSAPSTPQICPRHRHLERRRTRVVGDTDRHELLITHNFVIGWFVRRVLDAPQWRWIGLNQANCAITILQWDSDRPPTLVSFNDTGHL